MKFRTFIKDCKAVALLEFALSLPLLITIFVGVVEISNYVYFAQKVSNAGYNIANVLNSVDSTLSEPEMQKLSTDFVRIVMQPFPAGSRRHHVQISLVRAHPIDPLTGLRTTPTRRIWKVETGNSSLYTGPFGTAYPRCTGPAESRMNISDFNGVLLDPQVAELFNGYVPRNPDDFYVVEATVRYTPIFAPAVSRRFLGWVGAQNYSETIISRPRTRRASDSPYTCP